MNIHMLVAKIHKNPEDQPEGDRLLIDAAQKRGHTITLLEARQCKMVFRKKPQVVIANHPEKIHALIVRMTFSKEYMDTYLTLVKQFEFMGIPVMNSYEAIARTRNKIRMAQHFAEKNIPAPLTFAFKSAQYIEDTMKEIGKFPVIIKRAAGLQGIGVAIVETKRGLRSIIEMLAESEDSNPIIVQKYIRESSGKDMRVFVVGNQIVAAMDRIATKRGEFRSNFSIGGKVRVAELTQEEKKIALRAAAACGLDWGGVDIIRAKDGPKVLEVNSHPGLKGITQATNIDVAEKIIDYVVAKIEKKKLKKLGN